MTDNQSNAPVTYAEFVQSKGGSLSFKDAAAARHVRALHKDAADQVVRTC